MFLPSIFKRAAAVPALPPSSRALVVAPGNVAPAGKRLVFGFDATASRAMTWEAARELTDSLFEAVPAGLDLALAVHGGGKLHTFTAFSRNAAEIRKIARRIDCRGGNTQLIPLLRSTYTSGGVGTIVYIGDDFEEDDNEALAIGTILGRNGTRIIVLHEHRCNGVFKALAMVSNGAVLPFDASALAGLRDLLGAVAVMTAHGINHVKANQKTLPGAKLLLQHLNG